MPDLLLETRELKKHFPVSKGMIRSRVVGWIKAVDGVSIQMRPLETYALVGESGCGKTTTAKMILALEPPTSGSILFQGKDIACLSSKEFREYRTSVQAVFQDPYSSLNPRMRVASIVAEPLAANNSLARKERMEKVAELLAQVGLRSEHASLFPHEFSGGQRQRIAVARSLSLRPKLIVLDEPVSALDVSVRAQIMNLLKDLQGLYGMSYLLIAHNLATVRYMSHQVGVMYLGRIVELAPTEELFTHPLHSYTKALISASLASRPGAQREEIVLSGEVPSPLDPPDGCHFHPRCPSPLGTCSEVAPVLHEVAPGHLVACHHHHGPAPSPGVGGATG